MKIYIAIWNDRHTDTTARPFSSASKAITWAKATAKQHSKKDGNYQEHDYGKDDDWLFYIEYTCEHDCIYVIETELDN